MLQDSKSVLAQLFEEREATEQDGGKSVMFPIGSGNTNSEIIAGDTTYKLDAPLSVAITDAVGRPVPRGELAHPVSLSDKKISELPFIIRPTPMEDYKRDQERLRENVKMVDADGRIIPTSSVLAEKHNIPLMSETDVVTRLMPSQPNRATRRKAAKRAKQIATKTAPRNGRWFHAHR